MCDTPLPDTLASIDLTRLRGLAGFLLRLGQLRVYEAFQSEMAGLGMTPARYSLLAVLHDNPMSRSGQIAEALRVKPSNMAALLTQLETEGLIQRLPDPTERRASLVRLTMAGDALFTTIDPIVHGLEERMVDMLEPAERATLMELLSRFARLG